MGWNSLHAVCVQGKANEIEEEVMKKGTIVDEKSELVSACIRLFPLSSVVGPPSLERREDKTSAVFCNARVAIFPG